MIRSFVAAPFDRGYTENRLAWARSIEGRTPSAKMNSTGPAWHSTRSKDVDSFVTFAWGLARHPAPLDRVDWWLNVLREGAAYPRHVHKSRALYAFAYYLTPGVIRFDEGEHRAVAGEILVFPTKTPHEVPEVGPGLPRMTIAGNLFFARSPT